MVISIKTDKDILKIYRLIEIFTKYWIKLTVSVKLAYIRIKKGDYYFATT